MFNFSLVPLEGSGLFIVCGDEVIDRFAQLFDIDKAGSLERLAAQDAKPGFDLIKPGAVGRGKMKMNVGMAPMR